MDQNSIRVCGQTMCLASGRVNSRCRHSTPRIRHKPPRANPLQPHLHLSHFHPLSLFRSPLHKHMLHFVLHVVVRHMMLLILSFCRYDTPPLSSLQVWLFDLVSSQVITNSDIFLFHHMHGRRNCKRSRARADMYLCMQAGSEC